MERDAVFSLQASCPSERLNAAGDLAREAFCLKLWRACRVQISEASLERRLFEMGRNYAVDKDMLRHEVDLLPVDLDDHLAVLLHMADDVFCRMRRDSRDYLWSELAEIRTDL